MRDTLEHRGPDDAGLFQDDRVGLAHRRLSVIDLTPEGRQPMHDGRERVWVVFNGEIYNYRELRRELSAKGHVFRTQTDTEVLLHGYREWKSKLASKLNGMFAFALYDADEGKIILARDRMGQKPLYYSVFTDDLGERRLVFASEPRAILACPNFRATLDPVGAVKFLAYEYLPVPRSLLEGVKKLPGGQVAEFDLASQALTTEAFWRPNYATSTAFSQVSEAAEELYQRLANSIRLRLQSDVPLGVLLSGGLDSSTLVGLLCTRVGATSVKTFSIGFENPSFDESAHARAVADHFGTEHTCEVFGEERLLSVLPDVFAHLDEPLADPSVLPTYLLSAITRKSVTVALGGDGGDELFAGYDPFRAWGPAKLARALLPVPAMRGLTRRLVGLLPVSDRNMSFEFRLKRLLLGIDHPPALRHQAWLSGIQPSQFPELLAPAFVERLGGPSQLMPDQLWRECEAAWLEPGPGASELDRQTNQYVRNYLQEDILVKVDRASMAHALEVRAPFLDPGVIELANSLPDAWKLSGATTKVVLREAMKGLIAPDILQRPKKGFGIPVSQWLRGPLRSWIEDLLSPESLSEGEIFQPAAVRALLDAHIGGKRDHRKELWAIAAFMAWRRRWL